MYILIKSYIYIYIGSSPVIPNLENSFFFLQYKITKYIVTNNF